MTGHVRSCSQQFLTSAAETLAWPEPWALSWALFYVCEANYRPEWAPIALFSQPACVCVCECVWRWGRLLSPVCFQLFHAPSLWCSLSSVHPTRSLRLGLLVCSTPTLGLREGWGESWGCVAASHRDAACSVNPGRVGSVARRSTATERRVQWVEGLPGAKVPHTVQFSATLLCPFRLYPPSPP